MAKRKSAGRKGAAKPTKKVVKKEEPTSEEEEIVDSGDEDVVVTKRNGSSSKTKRDEKMETEGTDDQNEDVDEEPKAKNEKPGPKSSKAASKASKKKGKGPPSKKAVAGKPKTPKKKEESDSEPEDPDAEYEVETILDVEHHKKGREFLIKWKGYPRTKATWEPEENLDCPDKVEAFEKKLNRLLETTDHELRQNRKQTNHYQDSNRNQGVRTSRRFSAKPRTTYGGMSDD